MRVDNGYQVEIRHSDFNLRATLECAQAFGFEAEDEGYVGRIGGQKIALEQSGQSIRMRSDAPIDAAKIERYLSLDHDLSEVYSILEAEPRLRPSLQFRGLRLLRQDSWEVVAGFIISANNNFKRIQLIHRNLAAHFCPDTKDFPSAQAIANSDEATLRRLGLGYRAPYLFKTSKKVANNPEILESIRSSAYEEARTTLMTFDGVGPKVADCILLYGFHRLEAFPVDVWILRIMRKLFYNNRQAAPRLVLRYAQKKWGSHAGYVQQYLFHAARTSVI